MLGCHWNSFGTADNALKRELTEYDIWNICPRVTNIVCKYTLVAKFVCICGYIACAAQTWNPFFSQNGKYFSFLGLKFCQNICADFLTLTRGGGVYISRFGLWQFFLCYYCWMPRTSLTRLCCPEIGLKVFDPACNCNCNCIFLHFYNTQSFTFYCDQYKTMCKLVVLLSFPMSTSRQPKNRNKLGQRNTDHDRK